MQASLVPNLKLLRGKADPKQVSAALLEALR